MRKVFVLARIWGEVDLEKLGNKLRPELHIQSVRNVCDNFPESIITAQYAYIVGPEAEP